MGTGGLRGPKTDSGEVYRNVSSDLNISASASQGHIFPLVVHVRAGAFSSIYFLVWPSWALLADVGVAACGAVQQLCRTERRAVRPICSPSDETSGVGGAGRA